MQEKIDKQQAEIDQLLGTVDKLQQKLEGGTPSPTTTPALPPNVGTVASTTPVISRNAETSPPSSVAVAPVPAVSSSPSPRPAVQAEAGTPKVETLNKTVDSLNKGLAGFKLGGDFRYRTDGIWRHSNAAGGPQQNFRERYRVRFNVDKAITDQASGHLQLGSGTFNNPLTFDTDFAGVNNRGPIFITEFHGDYHPNKYLDFRGGKMQEVFAENDRFLLDDDVRFNGFQETLTIPLEAKGAGVKSIQFMGGQYILTNPNVQVLPSAATCAGANPPVSCAYLAAGFQPGQKVRDANLFDQGIKITAVGGESWSHDFTSNFQWWRNPNEIALASTAAGYPLLVNPVDGLITSSPLPGTSGFSS